ncbi:hypothetical protein F7725_009472, partial [Dissostichus mawsoni]
MGKGKTYKWTDLTVEDFYKYMGLLLYMALLKLDNVLDYWRQDNFLSVPLPAQVMSLDRHRTISWNLHVSDPDEDVQNDSKKGTPDHDRLFRLRPLMDTIKAAPKLFKALHALKFAACGTYRENRKDCPRPQTNSQTEKSQRGSIRWIREGPMVFVKWMDTR